MIWTALTARPDALGESPFWHPLEQMLYWLDIEGRKIHRADAHGRHAESWAMPAEPGCMAPARSGGLVIALRDGIYRARTWQGALECIEPARYDTGRLRYNDGKCDVLGRFWAGTIYEPRDADLASVVAIDCRSARPVLSTMIEGARVSNGLAWSPDNRSIYWADTPRHVVQRRDWDATSNQIGPPGLFHQFDAKPADWAFGHAGGYRGRPDGAAVDVLGNYHVAMYEGQRLCTFAPDGRLLAETATPVLCPTMPCFGGADLKTLYITSARHMRSSAELAAQPLAGCVFAMAVDTPGLPVNFFAD